MDRESHGARTERGQAASVHLLGETPDESGARVLLPVKDECGESLGAVGEKCGPVPDTAGAEYGDGIRRNGAQQRELGHGIGLPSGRAPLPGIPLIQEKDSGGNPCEEE